MRLTNKTDRWEYGETWVGRKKNFKVTIRSHDNPMIKEEPYWYFLLDKEQFNYNSLSEDRKYKTREECTYAAEQKIDELIRSKVINK